MAGRKNGVCKGGGLRRVPKKNQSSKKKARSETKKVGGGNHRARVPNSLEVIAQRGQQRVGSFRETLREHKGPTHKKGFHDLEVGRGTVRKRNQLDFKRGTRRREFFRRERSLCGTIRAAG